VVEMRVREDHGVDLGDRAGKAPVLRVGVGALSLEQATIEQNGFPLARTMWQEPVTSRAAPANSMFMSRF
jgi:hypothetical protein